MSNLNWEHYHQQLEEQQRREEQRRHGQYQPKTDSRRDQYMKDFIRYELSSFNRWRDNK